MKYYNSITNKCKKFVNHILKSLDGEFGKITKKFQNKGIIDFIYKDKKLNTQKELDDNIKIIDLLDFAKMRRNY